MVESKSSPDNTLKISIGAAKKKSRNAKIRL